MVREFLLASDVVEAGIGAGNELDLDSGGLGHGSPQIPDLADAKFGRNPSGRNPNVEKSRRPKLTAIPARNSCAASGRTALAGRGRDRPATRACSSSSTTAVIAGISSWRASAMASRPVRPARRRARHPSTRCAIALASAAKKRVSKRRGRRGGVMARAMKWMRRDRAGAGLRRRPPTGRAGGRGGKRRRHAEQAGRFPHRSRECRERQRPRLFRARPQTARIRRPRHARSSGRASAYAGRPAPAGHPETRNSPA